MNPSGSGSPGPSSRIAGGALLTALIWVCLLASGFLPVGRLFLLMLASFVLVAAARELGKGGAFLVYLASSLLALIRPGLITAAQFALLFGLLPLLTVWLRRLGRPWVERLIVHVSMTFFSLAILWLFGLEAFVVRGDRWTERTIVFFVVLALQFFLLVYYYALAQFEQFYRIRIEPWIHRRGS